MSTSESVQSKVGMAGSDFWKLPSYERLEVRDFGAVDPEVAAESFRVLYEQQPTVTIANADRAALAALDAHYSIVAFARRRFHPRHAFQTDHLLGTVLPSLGAFLGCVIVQTAGGRWQLAEPLMCSRVAIGERVVNPFRAAYDAVYFDVPLVELYDRLVG